MSEKDRWIIEQSRKDLDEVERLVGVFRHQYGHFDSWDQLDGQTRDLLRLVLFNNLGQWRLDNEPPPGPIGRALQKLIDEKATG